MDLEGSLFTYLITADVAESLDRKYGLQLNGELKERIGRLEREFMDDFWALTPDEAGGREIDRVEIGARDLSAKLEASSGSTGYPVVSLDRVYLTNANAYIEVTRMTDPATGAVGLSERPGAKRIEDQLGYLDGLKSIALADVGAFDGGTIETVCDAVERRGVSVDAISLGVCGSRAYDSLGNNRDVRALNVFDYYEWVELRDLFGIDGRNVGVREKSRLFMPYWENLPSWAGIPEKNENDARSLCKQANAELIGMLWQEGLDVSRIGTPVRFEGRV